MRPVRSLVVIAACSAALAAGVPVGPPGAGAGTVRGTSRGGIDTRRARHLGVAGSVEQVAVAGAPRGATVVLRDPQGRVVGRRGVDRLGAALFRDVRPGRGYRVTVRAPGGTRRPPAIEVLDPDAVPPPGRYRSQHLVEGYQYLRTRDGTLLAANVRLPGPVDAGPYPTVVEYSGYDPADPDSEEAASQVARLLGYATVGVNLRGSGCSGGAFDYLEPLMALDGYDVVETVAAQPWVAHGAVGMVGVSYSGITQLFVAATRPPHLAAITPLSVIDDPYRAVLRPGGVPNTGFPLEWAAARARETRPGGQAWVRTRIAHGDRTCATNQQLRYQSPRLARSVYGDEFADPATLATRTPAELVGRITAPVFLAGAWQDEQTGGHFATMLDRFAPDTVTRFTLTNGTHVDSLGPAVVTRWAEFLDLFVAHRVPEIPPAVRVAAPDLYGRLVKSSDVTLPPDRFAGRTDYDAVLTEWLAEPRVRVLFDNGAGAAPGAPVPASEATFAAWPVPGIDATPWYLGAGGTLRTTPPGPGGGADRYRSDPTVLAPTSHPGTRDDYFEARPAYDWRPVPEGVARSYTSAPLAETLTMVGSGSADLWLRSSAPDVDLEVVLSEVRPDGKETYVQSGWLRASHRALDRTVSTRLAPRQTHARADAAPLPRGRFTKLRVELFPFGHVFRADSRLRLTVQPPGGNRPRWRFAAIPADGRAVNELARTRARPSRVVLPVVRGVAVTTPRPPCPALRGQPCRDAGIQEDHR